MRTYHLYRSDKRDKKFCVCDESGHCVYFGATGYDDYTTHRDPSRLHAYNTRHRANERWRDPSTAGFWSKWILWHETTVTASIRATERRFRMRIVYHR